MFICVAKVLSTVASTASFDKHPQSQERGITLDLGKQSLCISEMCNYCPYAYVAIIVMSMSIAIGKICKITCTRVTFF